MWTQFFLENIRFAVSIITAIVFAGAGWLYFDAWTLKKELKNFLKMAGFSLLALSFFLSSVAVEKTTLVGDVWFTKLHLDSLYHGIKMFGYAGLIASLLIDPMPKAIDRKSAGLISLGVISAFLYPVLSSVVGFLYLQRGTLGRENHLKPVAYSFLLLTLFELIGLRTLFIGTNNVDVYGLVKPYGSLWLVQYAMLFITSLVLGRWVWYYLLKRLQTQLFGIYVVTTIVIFLVTATTFTGVLLKSLQDEALEKLTTNVKVLEYAVDSKKAETLSTAQLLAASTQVQQAVADGTKNVLVNLTKDTLIAKKQDYLLILDKSGKTLVRGEDREGLDYFQASDVLIKRAAAGESVASMVVSDGALAPEMSIRASVPVYKDGRIVGMILVGSSLDNAFVEAIQKATKLETSFYGRNVLAATSIRDELQKSSPIGIKEENPIIKQRVLQEGGTYADSVTILNYDYFGVYIPLRDIDNGIIGMLFVGKPQISIVQEAGRAIELTFLATVALIIFSIIPSYFISKHIAEQIK